LVLSRTHYGHARNDFARLCTHISDRIGIVLPPAATIWVAAEADRRDREARKAATRAANALSSVLYTLPPLIERLQQPLDVNNVIMWEVANVVSSLAVRLREWPQLLNDLMPHLDGVGFGELDTRIPIALAACEGLAGAKATEVLSDNGRRLALVKSLQAVSAALNLNQSWRRLATVPIAQHRPKLF
jgi:hypothetical protein